MTSLPGRREVAKALKTLGRAVKLARKGTNQYAARLLAKGEYTRAEALVGHAKALGKFEVEVALLITQWQTVVSAVHGQGKAPSDLTPLWEYYRPVLNAIVALGGEARISAIERHLEPLAERIWKANDLAPGSRGRPRWKAMVKKTRRQLVKEGWLEPRPLIAWRITSAGKKVAASGSDGIK